MKPVILTPDGSSEVDSSETISREMISAEPRDKRCKDLRPWISAFLDSELDAPEFVEERCRVEQHLHHCESCAVVAASWSEDLELLNFAPGSDVPESPWFVQRVMREARELAEATASGGLGEIFDPAALGHRPSVSARVAGSVSSLWQRSKQLAGANLGRRLLPVAVTALGLLLGTALRVQLDLPGEPTAMTAVEVAGSSPFELATLAARTVGDQEVTGYGPDFDSVLHAPEARQASAGSAAGFSTRAVNQGGVATESMASSARPEKDR